MSQLDLRLPPGNPGDVRATVAAGVSSPLPGSAPSLVSAAAGELRADAADLRAVLAQVRRLGQEQSFWIGSAADQFGLMVDRAPKHIDSVCVRYEGYAAILDEYAAILVLVRAAIPRRQRQLYLSGLQLSACSNPAAQQRAEEGCLAAYALLRSEYETLHRAAESAAHRLHRLDDASSLQNPQGWHALANSASVVFQTLSEWSAYVGLVAILVCPAAAPLFFGVAAAFSAAQLATDVVRSTTLGEPVSVTRFAEAALGAVPFTGLAKASAAGVQAGRTTVGIGSSVARGGSAALRSVATGAASEAREGVRGLSEMDRRQFLSMSARATTLGVHTEDVMSFAFEQANGQSPAAAAVTAVAAGIGATPAPAAGRTPGAGDRVPVTVRVSDGPGSRRVTIVVRLATAAGPAR